MALRTYANAPATTLAASCTAGATTITVASTTGLPITYPYIMILDRGTGSEEVVLVTNAAGAVLTVTRGYDSTTAFSHALGASAVHGISAIDPREANAHVNASASVHGVTGSVVGTTNTQTLTNKTLTSPTLNTPTVNDATFTEQGHTARTTIYTASIGVFPASPAPGMIVYDGSRLYVRRGTDWYEIGVDGVTVAGGFAGLNNTQTLTNKTLSNGTKVGAATTDLSAAWAAWTPTVTNWTVGNGTLTGRYMQIGKTVHFSLVLTLGSTSTMSSAPLFSFPVTPRNQEFMPVGQCSMRDASFGTHSGAGGVFISTSGTTMFCRTDDGGNVSPTAPLTWATGDSLMISGTYEAA